MKAPWVAVLAVVASVVPVVAVEARVDGATAPVNGVPRAAAVGILTFAGGGPTRGQLDALTRLGLEVQGMRRLPMAFVEGSQSLIDAAVRGGLAARFFPDERLLPASTAGNAATGMAALHDLGFTGEGTTVAIVDTGVDATHPDLFGQVTHNVEVVGPENAQLPADTPPGSLIVPVDQGPYSNTDAGDGHGTMVAGVIVGDGTTDERLLGAAPDADLVSYSASVGLWIRTVVAAYDHILDHPEWGIDVVNNSFGGTTWEPFDPGAPINIGTRALTGAGISVVFATGNAGEGDAPMSMSTMSAAPWVVSVGASTMAGGRGSFSSNGLIEDNAEPVAMQNGHVRFEGDAPGMYHPSVMAPGADIEVPCTASGVLYSLPCTGGTYTTSGTSLAAPHVAGLLALLEQARPELMPAQAKRVLEATATPTDPPTPFWQSGYGIVDSRAALEIVQHVNLEQRLEAAHARATRRVTADRPWEIDTSDHWSWPIPTATVAGVPDTRELSLDVPQGTDALRVTISSGSNVSVWVPEEAYDVTVIDADGQVVGSSEKLLGHLSTTLLDLRGRTSGFGEWTLRVEGKLSASEDPRAPWPVTVVAARLHEGSAPPPPPRVIDEGRLILVNGGSAASVTRTEFETTCAASPTSNGVDGWVTTMPAELADGEHLLTVRGTGLNLRDLDFRFYDASCALIGSDLDEDEGEYSVETSLVPAGTAYVLTESKESLGIYEAELTFRVSRSS